MTENPTARSVSGQWPGFLKATKSKTPGYYHRQLQEKNFQDDQFPAYLFHISR